MLNTILKACEISECGTMVMIITVKGAPFAVNPRSMETVVEDGRGGYRLVRGFEPHRNTCVNIGDRISRCNHRTK